MAYKRILEKTALLLFVLALVVVFFAYARLRPAVAPNQGSFIEINGQRIEVELADTPARQARGLSDHPAFTDKQGMLFIFPQKQIQSFWMKEMLFPLDIIWIDGGRVAGIAPDLPPEGQTPKNIYSSPEPVDRVLEVNAGWAERHKVKTGDRVEYHL